MLHYVAAFSSYLIGAIGVEELEFLTQSPGRWNALGAAEALQIETCRSSAFLKNPAGFYDKCCRSSELDLVLQADCFNRRELTSDSLKFARQHCCNDRKSALLQNAIFEAVREAVQCLSAPDSPHNGRHRKRPVLTTVVRTCSKKLMRKVLVLLQLPGAEVTRWQQWIGRMYDRPPGRLSRNYRGMGTRVALRWLAHLSLWPLAVVPDSNSPATTRVYDTSIWQDTKTLLDMSRRQQSAHTKQLFRKLLRYELPPDQPPIHIAMVASVGLPVFGRKALATIRSALFHAAKRPLHFHLFTDADGEKDLRSILTTVLEPELQRRAAAFEFHGTESMQRGWPAIEKAVPRECLMYNWRYGAPGFMRLFPQEVFTEELGVEHLIWLDAGDYVFFSDPAEMLRVHFSALKRKAHAMASYPAETPFAVQVFNLTAMREGDWNSLVEALMQKEWNARVGNEDAINWLCYRAEGSMMLRMTREYPDVFLPFEGNWAFEPRLPVEDSVLDSPHGDSLYADNNVLAWESLEYIGLINPMQAYIYCPQFADLFVHNLRYWSTSPFFSVELAQILEITNATVDFMQEPFREPPSVGRQIYVCGSPISALHLIRQFHYNLPWSTRLLDFWSNSSGLWRNSDLNKRVLPTSLNFS
eukprot:TRINITY_DN13779_c0_g2_i1.p1 TRINITY_DN13779_c0_g2~~TRINITY_DN13779_c0_g2_i1.p1  ORF type:complete len:650 (-),score=39.64 TRINITY_DN13779_c0_g2_i1:196-2118(-)